MTVLGGIVMTLGIALSVLSAFGVWRFPTAIARMHAATKSASLGLALVVLGAGIASSSPGIVGIGLLTTALLFLTAPISGHLLGRASYLTGAGQYQVDALRGVETAPLEVEPVHSPDFSLTRWLGLLLVWVLPRRCRRGLRRRSDTAERRQPSPDSVGGTRPVRGVLPRRSHPYERQGCVGGGDATPGRHRRGDRRDPTDGRLPSGSPSGGERRDVHAWNVDDRTVRRASHPVRTCAPLRGRSGAPVGDQPPGTTRRRSVRTSLITRNTLRVIVIVGSSVRPRRRP